EGALAPRHIGLPSQRSRCNSLFRYIGADGLAESSPTGGCKVSTLTLDPIGRLTDTLRLAEGTVEWDVSTAEGGGSAVGRFVTSHTAEHVAKRALARSSSRLHLCAGQRLRHKGPWVPEDERTRTLSPRYLRRESCPRRFRSSYFTTSLTTMIPTSLFAWVAM